MNLLGSCPWGLPRMETHNQTSEVLDFKEDLSGPQSVGPWPNRELIADLDQPQTSAWRPSREDPEDLEDGTRTCAYESCGLRTSLPFRAITR